MTISFQGDFNFIFLILPVLFVFVGTDVLLSFWANPCGMKFGVEFKH